MYLYPHSNTMKCLPCKSCRHHWRLTMEDILWCFFLKLGIPYKSNTIRIMRGVLIVVVAVQIHLLPSITTVTKGWKSS